MTSRPWTFRAAATAVALAAATAGFSTVAQADPAGPEKPAVIDRQDPASVKAHEEHDLEGPFTKTQEAQREEALKQVISGEAEIQKRDGSQVVELTGRKGGGKYVELGREKTDKIFTILVEFGDRTDPRYGGTPGPLHNQIAAPDRTKDNSTAWQADYDREHYQNLYFGDGADSMKTYYEKQSSGRYSIEGEVSDWVKVPYNEARYGSNKCDPDNCAWYAVQDGVTAWVQAQKAAGKSDAEIKAKLAEYDQWDRYDFDADGDFNERDGYIDHFQMVHAGEDESPAAARRARTRSGPTAGTRSAPTRAPPAPTSTSSAAPRSAPPASGSATTPSSRRTADSASSPTSTATTSACRTTTTPRAARTPPGSGP
ncbi:hypothetical protein SGLAM104S_00342 [Streptomyces glaucescens]